MTHLARIFIASIPYLVTQRGNGLQHMFVTDDDYAFYQNLLRQYSAEHGVAILANYRASLPNPQIGQAPSP